MSNILLAKQKLADGAMDAAVGEAHVVREALFKVFPDVSNYTLDLSANHKAEYPNPNGYEQLVKLLEDKYQAPVVITNGAKNALGASFYLLNKLGKTQLGMRTPYWCLIPPLAKAHNLECVDEEYNSYLAILPNNPDGHMISFDNAKHSAEYHKSIDIPYIVDSAYYTHSYLPKDYQLLPFGDLQIYSLSKMLGISGIRIGWIVCHNKDYYNTLLEYMETMTVGVSIPSQDIAYNILKEVWGDKEKEEEFIDITRNDLYVAKALCKTIDKRVLEVPDDITETNGMFLWAKANDESIFRKAKVNVISGEPFGMPGYIRMNLALPTSQIIEVVERLNRATNEV
jgi:aspartate/methionine/tyrosine aminotransferase